MKYGARPVPSEMVHAIDGLGTSSMWQTCKVWEWESKKGLHLSSSCSSHHLLQQLMVHWLATLLLALLVLMHVQARRRGCKRPPGFRSISFEFCAGGLELRSKCRSVPYCFSGLH